MPIPTERYLEIFTPDNAVSSIEAFAGRQDVIDTLANALQMSGTHIVIYGNRGVGKSSVARRLEALATSDPETVKRLSHDLLRKPDFLPIRFAADDSIKNIETLLVRLLQSGKAMGPWLNFELTKIVGKLGASIGVSAGPLRASVSGGRDNVFEKPRISTEVVGVFQNACDEIEKSGLSRDGLLIIIDEFDRISDTTGFASLVKATEGTKTRFAVVGVARDIEDLVQDHASINRQISDGTVLVKPMSDGEIHQIFLRAHDRMEGEKIFSEGAIDFITSCSRGHPYIVHLIGRQALITAVRSKQNVITETAAKEALAEIAAAGSIPLELDYRKAIKSSPSREFIMKAFSQQENEPTRTTEVYDYISRVTPMEKESISVYMGHLCSPEYGPVLEKTGERYYRFVNSVFKAYVAARDYELPRIDKNSQS